MKKYSVVAIALLCLSGMIGAANAQEEGTVVVNIPFEFIVGSKTLPAGQYTVRKTGSDTNSPLAIADHSRVLLVLPTAFDNSPVDAVRLQFEHVGDAYVLSQVKTPIGTYTIGTSNATANLAKLANMKTHGSTANGMSSASGSQ